MNKDNNHHRHDQTHHLDKAVKRKALKDPFCGMDIGCAKQRFKEIKMTSLKMIYSIFKIIPLLSIFACTQVPNSSMGNRGHMMGYGYGGGYMWLILLVIIGIVAYFLPVIFKDRIRLTAAANSNFLGYDRVPG